MRDYLYKAVSTLMIIASLMLVGGSVVTVASGTAEVQAADTVEEIKKGVTGSGGTGAKNQGGQVPVIIRTVVNILLFLIGAFAVIMIVIAGFRYVASNGDANTVSSAKNTIIYALIGLAVAFLAYAVVNFVIDQLIQGSARS
jgi:hypothetical protein